jgi:hypothetical protein
MNHVPVLWRSGKQRTVALSTAKAELRAMYDCIDSMLLLMHFMTQLRVSCSVRLFSDSEDAVKLINAVHPKPSEKHLVIELRKYQELKDGVVGSRVERLVAVSEKRLRKELDVCKQHVLALRELCTFMPCTPIAITHIPGSLNPSDALTKPVDTERILVDSLMHRSSVAGCVDDAVLPVCIEHDPVDFVIVKTRIMPCESIVASPMSVKHKLSDRDVLPSMRMNLRTAEERRPPRRLIEEM